MARCGRFSLNLLFMLSVLIQVSTKNLSIGIKIFLILFPIGHSRKPKDHEADLARRLKMKRDNKSGSDKNI